LRFARLGWLAAQIGLLRAAARKVLGSRIAH
jgi:hypothetical protein